MYNAYFKIKGLSGIIFGKAVLKETKKRSETHAAFDKRTWQEKCRVNEDGQLYLPGIALKACITSTAKYMGMPLEDNKKRTYTQSITRGLQCVEPLMIDGTMEDIELLNEYVLANPGGTSKSRVMRIFPHLPQWTAEGVMTVIDDVLKPDILRLHLRNAGMLTGLGTWRPESGREYGRFLLTEFDTEEREDFNALAA